MTLKHELPSIAPKEEKRREEAGEEPAAFLSK
uniref:Uncharacterized protein n=1 Tax=Romanomermis culicivorax TaxID=13658 RepID=A0A915I9R5_ROMCU